MGGAGTKVQDRTGEFPRPRGECLGNSKYSADQEQVFLVKWQAQIVGQKPIMDSPVSQGIGASAS